MKKLACAEGHLTACARCRLEILWAVEVEYHVTTWLARPVSHLFALVHVVRLHSISSNFLRTASGTMIRSNARATPPNKTTPYHAPNHAF